MNYAVHMQNQRDSYKAAYERVAAERDGLERVARVLLRQVKRGGPSNIERFATDYFGDDAALFTARVAGEAESA